ncbi:MAG: sigma-54-dependent Fis family transcriptional regulator [Betaproteobacteria bacterium]|nr:sigma-54-dependent Fis family transcriptional regulator [Betaproteobacteria bacterium]
MTGPAGSVLRRPRLAPGVQCASASPYNRCGFPAFPPAPDRETCLATKPTLLIVDDDPLISESLSFALGDDFEVALRGSRMEAMALLRSGTFVPSLALIDLGLPPVPHQPDEGFKLVGDLLAWSQELKIFILSGQNEESNARRARALGAYELVPKPCDPVHLRRMLMAALAGKATERPAPATEAVGELIGDTPPMRKLKRQIDLYAASMFPALIEGESGTGKERVAAALHHLSPRAHLKFLALNCAAISANLVEPTLFGHAKGAFTGAATHKSGYFEDAGEGTLFLDEIGELPLDLQPKLLRVLENGEYQRVGETQTRQSRARIVAATNRDLKAEVKAGRFRADLYHRLSVFTLSLPPLRDLADDKLRLLDHYRAEYARRHGTGPFELDAGARAAWLGYGFPGNVRELKNIVIRLLAKYAGYTVTREELVAEFESEPGARHPESTDGGGHDGQRPQIGNGFNLGQELARIELQFIDAAIDEARGNMSQAARLLGVSRSTLYSRLDALRPGRAREEQTDN